VGWHRGWCRGPESDSGRMGPQQAQGGPFGGFVTEVGPLQGGMQGVQGVHQAHQQPLQEENVWQGGLPRGLPCGPRA